MNNGTFTLQISAILPILLTLWDNNSKFPSGLKIHLTEPKHRSQILSQKKWMDLSSAVCVASDTYGVLLNISKVALQKSSWIIQRISIPIYMYYIYINFLLFHSTGVTAFVCPFPRWPARRHFSAKPLEPPWGLDSHHQAIYLWSQVKQKL